MRDQHAAAVSAVVQTLGELQELLALATEKADMAIGMAQSAIGTDVESARNVSEYTGAAATYINQAFGSVTVAVDEARRYMNGF